MALSGKAFEEVNRQATSPLDRRALLVESSPFSRRLNRRSYHLGSQLGAGSDVHDVTLPRKSPSRTSTSCGLPTYSPYQGFKQFESKATHDLIRESGGCGMSPPQPRYRTEAEPNNHMVMAVGATDVTAHFVSRPSYSLRDKRFLKHSSLFCEFLSLTQNRPESASLSLTGSHRRARTSTPSSSVRRISPFTPSIEQDTHKAESLQLSNFDESEESQHHSSGTTQLNSTTPTREDASITNPSLYLPKTFPSTLRRRVQTPSFSGASNSSSIDGGLSKSLELLHKSSGHHREQERRLRQRLAKNRDELQSITKQSHPLQVFVHL